MMETENSIEEMEETEPPPPLQRDVAVRSTSPSGQTLEEMQDDDIRSFRSDESFDLDIDDNKDDRSLAGESMKEKLLDTSKARFNMELLRRCIEDGQPTLNKIDGKNVCLVIGKTGTGKSTLIQGFAGKTFRAVEHVTVVDGKNLTKIVYEPDDPLEGFEIGHDKVSKTHSITCFQQRSPGQNDEIYFVDSPGFEDTGGHEIDTATSVLLRQVAERCKTLKFIIVVSFSSLLDARGQPMRGILKMIKSFVNDFKQEQKSFMFLFSHMPPSQANNDKQSYERLRKEIEDLLQGSTDEDVKVVLQFLTTSLRHKYPYVQIVSPETSDFPSILRFAERKLKPIDGVVTGNCGLTMSSQLKLNGEVPRALLEVKSIFEKDYVDSKRVLDIFNTLASLHHYVGSADIELGVAECKRCIDGFCDNARAIVSQKIDQGTELGAPFGADDIVQLKKAARYLVDLAGMEDTVLMDRILLRVSKFRDNVLEQFANGNLHPVSDSLGKMKCWADGFPDPFLTWYIDLRLAVEAWMKIVKDTSEEFSVFDLGSAEETKISDLVAVLSNVSSWQRHLNDLTPHGIDVSGITASQELLYSRVVQVAVEWRDDVQVACNPHDTPWTN